VHLHYVQLWAIDQLCNFLSLIEFEDDLNDRLGLCWPEDYIV